MEDNIKHPTKEEISYWIDILKSKPIFCEINKRHHMEISSIQVVSDCLFIQFKCPKCGSIQNKHYRYIPIRNEIEI